MEVNLKEKIIIALKQTRSSPLAQVSKELKETFSKNELLSHLNGLLQSKILGKLLRLEKCSLEKKYSIFS